MEMYSNRKLIGENLADYLFLKGYSKLQFSQKVGISRPTIYRILKRRKSRA